LENSMKLNAIALALGLASSSAFAGTLITIDPDGLGSEGTISVSALGWNNGNSIANINRYDANGNLDVNGLIQTYGQASLANFNNAASSAIGGLGLNSSYQWTYVFGVQEDATTTGTNATFKTTSGGENFFKIYYNSALTSSNVNGTGFTDGQLILSGTIRPYDSTSGTGYGTFASSSGATVALDQNGVNNYAGILTTTGTGSTSLEGIVSIGFADSNFFKNIGSEITIALDSSNNQPFKSVDPSSCFTNQAGSLIPGAGPNNAGGSCTSAIGTLNGIDGGSIMFQTRATNDFVVTTVPEPTSMALVGAGLLSLVGLSRRKRA